MTDIILKIPGFKIPTDITPWDLVFHLFYFASWFLAFGLIFLGAYLVYLIFKEYGGRIIELISILASFPVVALLFVLDNVINWLKNKIPKRNKEKKKLVTTKKSKEDTERYVATPQFVFFPARQTLRDVFGNDVHLIGIGMRTAPMKSYLVVAVDWEDKPFFMDVDGTYHDINLEPDLIPFWKYAHNFLPNKGQNPQENGQEARRENQQKNDQSSRNRLKNRVDRTGGANE